MSFSRRLLCLWLLMVSGCVLGDGKPIKEMVPSTASASPTSLTSVGFTPVATATATLPSLPPVDILQYRPVVPESGWPAEIVLDIALLFYDDPPRLLYFGPEPRTEVFDVGDAYLDSLSPDGKWVAYYPVVSADSPGQLVVESADRREKYTVPLDDSLGIGHWLDNERLIFDVFRKYTPSPMVVINPFTGERIELPSDYPGIDRPMAGPLGTTNFSTGDVVYDPTLELVVYPWWRIGASSCIVLWNRRLDEDLICVEEESTGAHDPLWSPDASKVAIAVAREIEEKYIEEWFLVNRRGEINQQTRFADYFRVTRIGYGSWSPDGARLAFWLMTDPSSCGFDWHLAIWTIGEKQIVDTCFGPSHTNWAGGSAPLWLNEHLIVVNDWEKRVNILVDLDRWRAYDITQETAGKLPIGGLRISP